MGQLYSAGDQFGRYEIVRRIGQGGMGVVLEARQVDLGRSVALKVLNPELARDPEFRARFENEARALAALDSPHVIQVFDAGEHAGELFIATQLVAGRDLLQILRADGPLATPDALAIVSQVASALADAHEAGLLHRDLKPSNILVREGRAELLAYLCDFGIARRQDAGHTSTNGGIGTLAYMAPECHEGAEASTSSDIYSLGCVLWAALTGRAPYERTSEFQVALAHLRDDVPTYAGTSPAAAEINRVLHRAMAKDPSRRFESAAQMREALLRAEEISRGVTRPSADPGGEVPMDPNRTQVRVAAPPGRVRAGGPHQAAARRGRVGVVALFAAVLLVIAGLGGTAAALLGRGEKEAPKAAMNESTASPSASATGTQRARPRPQAAKKRSRPAATSASQSPVAQTQPNDSEPTSPVTTTKAPAVGPMVDCWDGSRATAALACPLPSGRAGLSSVFPSMDEACVPVGPTSVSGKAEVFECEYGSYMVRYSRWMRGADRYGYLDRENKVPGGIWLVGGEFAGRQWWSFENDANESKPHQWSATYRHWPYSVSVEGMDSASRAEGVARVEATSSEQVALR